MGGYWRETRGADDPGERIEQSSQPSTDRPSASWPNLEAASTEKLLQAMGYDWKDLTSEVGDLPRESQAAIERFEPRQANLPELTREEAGAYIRDTGETRPWLRTAERAAPEIQHVVASVDQGGGHAAERHEGFTAGERNERRVDGLEDPAQLDPDLRAEGKDAMSPERRHRCGDTATAINNPEAFAAAFARGAAHPDIQATLGRPRSPEEVRTPRAVEIPIEELLGEDGANHCEGHRLLPIDGDIEAAKRYRLRWVNAEPEQRAGMTRPATEAITNEEFRGGTIVFAFGVTADRSHWEITTMYPKPRDRNEPQP
ncbi:hypothetical protein [Flindersiella endophytica]